ncbi:MAG: polysaccharide deacetylase family protein, partial [Bacteroidetes bacterium]|nr:polysaccharide deacetylase family protein [Bacteroidota bacterium]
MNLFRTPFFLPKFYPSLLWRVPTENKELYLTFDDGPMNGPTEFVLEELKKVKAKATFFCIGDNVSKHPDVFQKVIAQGHSAGNHTFNHLKGWSTSLEKYLNNIAQCETHIQSQLPVTGYQPLETGNQKPVTKFFRPPYGRITNAQIKALKYQYQI